jgi:hypothetical protein
VPRRIEDPRILAHPGPPLRREARTQIAKPLKRPRTHLDNGDPRESARSYPKLSRKALVNSTLLAFDEPSLSPASNSIIDF